MGGRGMRMLGLIVLTLLAVGITTGIASQWQMVGLLNVADRLRPGAAGQQVARGVAYGAGPMQRVDIFRPRGLAAQAKAPIIIWIHGGGWENGSRQTYGFAGRAFAAEGFVTVVIGYRLGAPGRFPAFMEDARDAIGWTHAHIGKYGGDPERMVIAGQSAGAHMALLAALDPQWLGAMARPGGAIRGVIGLSGPYDFAPFKPGDSADRAMGHVRPVSETQPIHYVRADAPPLFLATGDADTTVKPRNTRALAAAMAALNPARPVETRYYAGLDHADTVKDLSLLYRNNAPVLADAVHFARSVTAAPAPVLHQR